MCSILGPVRKSEASDPVQKLTDWKLFQSIASEFMYPDIQIRFSDEADIAAHAFAASVASAYRISTREATILDQKRGKKRRIQHAGHSK
jgi:hypothetical protein